MPNLLALFEKAMNHDKKVRDEKAAKLLKQQKLELVRMNMEAKAASLRRWTHGFNRKQRRSMEYASMRAHIYQLRREAHFKEYPFSMMEW